MGLFEHVAVGFSMVLSFGVARLLDGLRPALAPGKRYWVHALWLVQKLFGAALYWWGFVSFREGITWTLASFLWMLLPPGFLFLQATVLVGSNPTGVASWRDHFFDIRRWFFSVDVALILHSIITSSLLRGLPLLHPFRALQLAGLTLSVWGAVSASPRVHATIAPMALGLQSLGLGALFFRPRGF
jgi:hypothetical protein